MKVMPKDILNHCFLPFLDGVNSINYAIYHYEAHKELLDLKYVSKIDCDFTDDYVEFLVECAKQGVYHEIRNYYNGTPLHFARTAEQTRVLIEAGANVNARNNSDYTPLHRAETADQIRVLIEAGANVNSVNYWGYTPLHYAKNTEQTRALIEAGANVNSVDRGG